MSLGAGGIIPSVRFSRAPFPEPRTLRVPDGAAFHQGPCTSTLHKDGMAASPGMGEDKPLLFKVSAFFFCKQLGGGYFQLRRSDGF